MTSHRLFYIDVPKPHSRSFVLDLSTIVKTEHYAGLFTSSSKVTIYLTSETPAAVDGNDAGESWQCEVCDFRNPPGSSPTGAKCALCGVPRSKVRTAALTPPRAVSAPPPSAHLLPSSPLPAASGSRPKEIACPACTFLNHPDLTACEICGTALPRSSPIKSAPPSRPGSPTSEGDAVLRLSFRKGGDKALYAVLKRSVLGRAWQVRPRARARRPSHILLC